MKTTLCRALTVLTIAVGGAVTAACSSDSAVEPEPEVPGDPNTPAAGTFALEHVDTKALPFAILSDSFYKLEVTAGSAILQTDGAFLIPITTRETVAGYASTYVDTTRGTWTQNVGTILLTPTPGTSTANALWDGRRLTIAFATAETSNSYVFKRQEP